MTLMIHEFVPVTTARGYFPACRCGWSDGTCYPAYGPALTVYLRLHSDRIPVRDHYVQPD